MTPFGRMQSVVLITSLLLAVAACSGDGTTTQPEGTATAAAGDAADSGGGIEPGTEVVVGTDAEPTTLDVQFTDDNGKDLGTWSINEGLVNFGPDGELVPLLAAELPTIDENDENRWLVTLREGIEFSNGEPFDAEAVVANLDRILDPDYGSSFTAELETIDHAEVVSDSEVAIITNAPDPILPYRLRALRLVAPEAAQSPDYPDNPVGTGPYLFEGWVKGDHMTLKANPDYWGEPKPQVETVTIRFMPDVNTRMSALQSGEIDLAINVPPALADNAPALITSSADTEVATPRFSLVKHPYSDPNFRRALNYAVNKEEMNEQLFNGLFAVTPCQPVVEGAGGGYNPDLEPYPYDPDRARELLEEVDLPDDFVMEFEAAASIWANDREIGEALSGYWRAIGLEVDTTYNEIDSFLEKIFTEDDPGLIYTESDQSFNHGARQLGLYVGSPPGSGSASAFGDTFGPDSELAQLVDTALTAFDEEAREAAYREIWEMSCDDAWFLWTLNRRDITGASERVDYTPGLGLITKFDFHRLRVAS